MELQVTQVIEELSKIDTATDKVLSCVDTAKEYLAADAARRKVFEESLAAHMQERIESFKQSIQTEQEQFIKDYRAKTSDDLAKLDESFEKKHVTLANDIFNQLIALSFVTFIIDIS